MWPLLLEFVVRVGLELTSSSKARKHEHAVAVVAVARCDGQANTRQIDTTSISPPHTQNTGTRGVDHTS